MSIMEAEYVPISDATMEAICLGRRQMDQSQTPAIYRNSQEDVALAKNMVHYNVSKHIEVQYHFVKDNVARKQLGLEKIFMIDNVAGVMNKSLSSDWP